MAKKFNGFNLMFVLLTVVITSIISAITSGVIVYNNNRLSSKVTYGDLAKDENLNEFLEVYAKITSDYYQDVDKDKLLESAISAMMNYLGDDYTTYLDNETTEDLLTELAGEYKGIGVTINNSDKTISEVFDDSPASKAGIKVGDIIIGYNNEDLSNLNADEIVNKIKKDKNTFTLKLKRGEEEVTVTLKNEKIISPSIEYNMMDDKTGYIYISTFSGTLDIQMSKALNKLKEQGMTNLIIDVRDNTGGYLDAATKVANLFLEKGKTIFTLNYKDENIVYKDETREHQDCKIVILINENTASASEILAAALKDNYGAILVGETSFGKGKVQETKTLDTGGMVKDTSAYWLTPNGKCIDGVGLKPDYAVQNEEVENNETNEIVVIDNQLQKAKDILK